MKLSLVSFTGADDNVDPLLLHQLQQEFSFIEWAILWHGEYRGIPRYPSLSWIERFVEQVPGPKALHLCTSTIHDFLAGDAATLSLAQKFDRVQINFFQKRDPVDAVALDRAIRAFGKPVIVPLNPGNDPINELLTAPNVQGLFDRSGGKGIAPDSWPEARAHMPCGYAGGLKPENIALHLPLIFKAAAGRKIWIDMESGLRDASDRFDFARARQICVAAQPYCG